MVTTGYSDTFGRTVANGFGTATSGQAYTVAAPATQYSVAPNTATIAISAAGNPMGIVDLQSQNVDITGQVALNKIPTTNLATVGFAAKMNTVNNGYMGQMMVATGGAVSIRFSKIVAGGLVTLATVATGFTYVAGTFYNLRFSAFWSRPLQTNILQAKLWALNADQPGGWMAVSTSDAAFTDYTAGTQVGLYARDESTVVGTVVATFQNVAVRSYNLPMPATTDPMCFDPAVTYPKQTVLQDLAQAADAAMTAIDPIVTQVGAFPRVRLSTTLLSINTANFLQVPFNTVEFNVGTPTNLAYDNQSIRLPLGVWLVTFEMVLADSVTQHINVTLNGTDAFTTGFTEADMRTNASQANDQGIGGCIHVSKIAVSPDPTTPAIYSVNLFADNLATTYVANYAALSAIKMSDYFA